MTRQDRIEAWGRLAVFYGLALAISITAFSLARHGDPGADSLEVLLANPWALVAKFGPSLAGLITAAMMARGRLGEILIGIVNLRDPAALFGWGLLLPAFGALVPALIAAQLHSPPLVMARVDAETANTALGYLALRTFMGGGLGEELGWRAFALPVLLTLMGPKRASVLLGLLWGLWHAPALISKGPEVWVAQIVFTISVSLIFSYIWLHTRNPLPVVILAHGAINAGALIVEGLLLPALDNDLIWQVGRIFFFLIIGLGLAALPWRSSAAASGVRE